MTTTRLTSVLAKPTAERKAIDRERVYRIIADAPNGATDDEIQDVLEMDGSTERPRRGELVVDDRVRPSGRVRPTRSGRRAIVWIVTE